MSELELCDDSGLMSASYPFGKNVRLPLAFVSVEVPDLRVDDEVNSFFVIQKGLFLIPQISYQVKKKSTGLFSTLGDDGPS